MLPTHCQECGTPMIKDYDRCPSCDTCHCKWCLKCKCNHSVNSHIAGNGPCLECECNKFDMKEWE